MRREFNQNETRTDTDIRIISKDIKIAYNCILFVQQAGGKTDHDK